MARKNKLLMKQQVRLEAATTFPFGLGVYSQPGEYWYERYRLGLPLDPMSTRNSPYGRPGLHRAYSTGSVLKTGSPGSRPPSTLQQSGLARRRSQPIPPPTFAERVALGPQLNPWHPKNPHRLVRRGTIHDIYTARKEQRQRELEHYQARLLQLRRQQRRAQQLDGSKSDKSSPSVSRSSSEKSLLRVSSWKNLLKERTVKKNGKAKKSGLGR